MSKPCTTCVPVPCRTPVGCKEFQSEQPTNETIMMRLCRAFLGRYPADNEIAYWAGELHQQRETVGTRIVKFANSAEFTQILKKYFP